MIITTNKNAHTVVRTVGVALVEIAYISTLVISGVFKLMVLFSIAALIGFTLVMCLVSLDGIPINIPGMILVYLYILFCLVLSYVLHKAFKRLHKFVDTLDYYAC